MFALFLKEIGYIPHKIISASKLNAGVIYILAQLSTGDKVYLGKTINAFTYCQVNQRSCVCFLLRKES